jgi:hypothetical protein
MRPSPRRTRSRRSRTMIQFAAATAVNTPRKIDAPAPPKMYPATIATIITTPSTAPSLGRAATALAKTRDCHERRGGCLQPGVLSVGTPRDPYLRLGAPTARPKRPHEAGPSSPVQDADGGCREKDQSGYQQDRDDRRVSRPARVGGDDQRDDQKCDRRAAPQDGPYWAELLHAMHPAGGAESVVETTWISRSMPARGAVALG